MPTVSDRHFGYEFEASTPLKEMKKIIKPIIETVYGKNCLKCSTGNPSTEKNYKYWHLKDEPSSEAELCTPISTIKDLKKISQVAKEMSKNGVKITKDDSLHIHVQANDVDPRTVLAAWIQYESVIKDCFPARRWKKSCNPYNVEFIKYKGNNKKVADFLKDAIQESECRSHLLCFDHFKERKTIEFRISEGTLDPDHVQYWAKFCICFVSRCKKLDPIEMLCSDVNYECVYSLADVFNMKEKKLREWLFERHDSKLR